MTNNIPKNTKQVAVLGSGAFGMVLAQLLAENGAKVRILCRRPEVVDSINRYGRNPDYLDFLELQSNIEAVDDIKEAVSGAWMIVLAVPGTAVEQMLENLSPHFSDRNFLVSVAKGIAKPGFRLMHQLIESFLDKLSCPRDRYAIMGGPNIAYELAYKKLAGAVIASHNHELADLAAKQFASPYFMLFHNNDICGVELGGALKNVYAIVAGLSDANNMGDNTKSLLIARAIAEISRFATEFGANPMTLVGLAGAGDLIVTCFSPKSRNYQLGLAIASNKSLDGAISGLSGVAEGVNTLEELCKKADELGVYMPLARGIYEIIFQRQNYLRIFRRLIDTMQESDIEFQMSTYKNNEVFT